ncbi:Craniofacial development protein 2 [Stylophora pistillata]|uniref:Craniofacial development protein 2 n=1 Tax=Stylophora pistillata TaxID=50429 RepID=A0A2B4R3M3_STYPI|nr:Craniofacial development protein 2 [Stylophora pistillata]
MVEPGSTESERVMHIKLNTDLGPTNLLSVYAPTLTSSTDAKDTFYSQLDDAIKHIPSNEVLILLGDFNARVGNDQGSWPDCLGHFGVGKCNENGQRLLELCTYHHLCITNTFFGVKLHHSPKLGDCLELNTEDHWSHIKDKTLAAALKAFGRNVRKSQDWFNTHIVTLQPLIEAKRNALQNYQRNPSPSSMEALREARHRVNEKCNICANNFWMNLCAEIQSAADTGNSRGMSEGMKKAIETYTVQVLTTQNIYWSEAFDINSGVKQGCVLAPTLFNIFFSLLLNHAFESSEEGILIRSRSDGKLFHPARLRAKTKARKVAIRDLLFADDVALVAHSAEKLQLLLNQFSDACEAVRLTSSLEKTKVMSQDNAATPAVTIEDYILEAVTQFTYLGCTTSNNNYFELEIGKRIGKAATNMAKLSTRVWENKKLTTQTKVAVYRACIVSTLIFGSQSWITYASQEKRLNIFHMRCLRRILSISWTDKVSNNEVLARSNIPSSFTLVRQRRLRWLGDAYRMEDG